MNPDQLPCPTCDSPYGYPAGEILFMCPECGYEWDPTEVSADEIAVKDVNGTLLKTGDDVIVIKNLPVKGAPKPIKSGTKVKNIRVVEAGDHNIDCKIDGFGKMALKAQFVRKA